MGAYYYASGHRIELEDDDEHVAVDKKIAERAGLDATAIVDASAAPRAGGGVLIARRSALGKETLATLQKAGALQPIYKRDRAVVVAMPEVRVEFDNPAQRKSVIDLLATIESPHTIEEDSSNRMVIRPATGNGNDALKIANDIYERARPAAASVRFVQFVPKRTAVR